ncbi:MAG: hypothetical protein HC804_10525 [Anaerolineae bacterium]|nr:hypothetical protein [Anaerolineae bacterium]
MKQLTVKTIDMAWRVLVIAAGYTLAGVVLGMLGLLQANPEQETDATAVRATSRLHPA